jgi:hypothetical protein
MSLIWTLQLSALLGLERRKGELRLRERQTSLVA